MSVGLIAVGNSGLAILSADSKSWAVQTTPTANQLNAVHYAQGQFVAAGAGGVAITSADGVSWISPITMTGQELFKPWFSDNLWVIPGNNVTITSSDAITWTAVAGPFAVNQNGVAKDATTYVLVADGGSVATSPDATTWTPQTSGVVLDLFDVVYAPWLSLFVAVGETGTILTSPDGVTWTPQTSNTSSDLQDATIDTDNQLVIAAGENGTIVTSPDGLVWTPQASSTTVDQWEGVFYDKGLYIVVGSSTSSQIINTSLDAVAWQLESGAGIPLLRGVSGSLIPGIVDGVSSGTGWGTQSWGVDPWGSTIPLSPLALQRAVAITTKEVEITLNRAPQVIAATVDGDALNPSTWTIQRLDNGFVFSVLSVRQVDEERFVLSVLQDFGSSLVQHRVTTTTLLDADGNPISSPPLNQADYAGLLAAAAKDAPTVAAQRLNAIRDVANPPLTPSGNIEATSIGGTLVINSGGDYETESGAVLLKKLIIRRLTTQPGGFFHLPGYGIGLGVKEVLPASNLIQIRAEAIRQIRLEKEVAEADVQLILGTNNDLSVFVKVRSVTGDDLDFSVPVPPNEIVF